MASYSTTGSAEGHPLARCVCAAAAFAAAATLGVLEPLEVLRSSIEAEQVEDELPTNRVADEEVDVSS